MSLCSHCGWSHLYCWADVVLSANVLPNTLDTQYEVIHTVTGAKVAQHVNLTSRFKSMPKVVKLTSCSADTLAVL